MDIQYKSEDKLLLISLTEEIDHHTTEKIRRKVDYEIERYLPKKVIFDFNSVSFMDSAGIGMLIGRYKLVNMLGGDLNLTNVKTSVAKILNMCGVLKIIPICENPVDKGA